MSGAVLEKFTLGMPWATTDPFLFCVFHEDRYPAGNAAQGPDASLAGRDLGMDFEGRDGWRMYHGHEVPGFPAHPHRGFETVTIVRKGFVDHSDSLGAAARFGHGDVQWLTAGAGIVHAEMFPLRERARENPTEFFQLWLNLPRAQKLAPPHFSMFWGERVPVHRLGDAAEVTVVAGAPADWGLSVPAPPPHSYAARPESEVAIWTLRVAPGAEVTLPPARDRATRRVLYVFRGAGLRVAGEAARPGQGLVVAAHTPVALANGANESELLLLQGRPIGEPVAQHGPFVMNRRDELVQAFADYQATRFGGWPWSREDPVHPREEGRFARYPDGRVERPEPEAR
jgi:redox-sensitive bicupin YhaK (pirin superfamily)